MIPAVDFRAVEESFARAIAEGVFPGAVLLIGKDDAIVYERAFGNRSLLPEKTPMLTGTIFDLASLTKPLATSVALMLLVREQKLRLDDQVTRVIPMYGVFGKSLTTFRHLLNHTAGLPAWKPYFEEVIKSEKTGTNQLCREPCSEELRLRANSPRTTRRRAGNSDRL